MLARSGRASSDTHQRLNSWRKTLQILLEEVLTSSTGSPYFLVEHSVPMLVLAIVDDLFFQAKIETVAAPLGLQVRVAKTLAHAHAAWSKAAMVLVDLNFADADPLEMVRALRVQRPDVPIIGYGSHVQADLLAKARTVGCTTVLPRSAFVQQLPRLFARVDGSHVSGQPGGV